MNGEGEKNPGELMLRGSQLWRFVEADDRGNVWEPVGAITPHNAALQPQPKPEGVREAVARIIDPTAWEEYLLEDGRVDEEVASIFQDAYEESLVKADAILSLPALRWRGDV